MPKVIFKFDKEKDLLNYWDQACRKRSQWSDFFIDEDIKKICEGKNFGECKLKLSERVSQIQNSEIVKIYLASIEKSWRIIEKEFFHRMDKLMKNKFDQDISAYLTTLRTCPYDPDEVYFMFSLFNSIPKALNNCGHEIMHLYFHKFYWRDIEKEIGKEKTADIKEALTVLLNEEFKDLWFFPDHGYESHVELREFISKEWKKKKDFPLLLKKCVKYLKEQ